MSTHSSPPTMTPESKATVAWRYFRRATRLQCPICGKHPIFCPVSQVRSLHDWFTPLHGCPTCQYAYDREPGYFLMATWAANYGVAGVLGVAIYGILEWKYELPIYQLMAAVFTPIIIFSILFVRHAKAYFLAFDHFFDPHEKK